MAFALKRNGEVRIGNRGCATLVQQWKVLHKRLNLRCMVGLHLARTCLWLPMSYFDVGTGINAFQMVLLNKSGQALLIYTVKSVLRWLEAANSYSNHCSGGFCMVEMVLHWSSGTLHLECRVSDQDSRQLSSPVQSCEHWLEVHTVFSGIIHAPETARVKDLLMSQ